MRNHKKLLLEQLDRKLVLFRTAEHVQVPEKGWINNIRHTFNMTLEQLGDKLNMTKQGIRKIEERESSGGISLETLKEVGKVFDMKLVYGFVPNGSSVESLIDKKAQQLARRIVLRTSQNMKLENQGNRDEQIVKAIDELAYEIKKEMRKSLWD